MREHTLKSWSNTQGIIETSSGEAEYYGMVKGGSVGLGIKALLCDLGVSAKINLRTDASAAKGIASRKGLGKVRHIEVNQLWLQDRVATGDIQVLKVKGTVNLADALTKYVEGDDLVKHSEWMGMSIDKSRHSIMPATQSEKEENLNDDSDEEEVD